MQTLLKTRDEYLADAESEVTKLRNEIVEINNAKSAYLVELEQKISSLRAEVSYIVCYIVKYHFFSRSCFFSYLTHYSLYSIVF